LKQSLSPGTAAAKLLGLSEIRWVCLRALVWSKSFAFRTVLRKAFAHLSRHCKKVSVADLPMQHGGITGTLRAHAAMTRADLMVMGGYAHPRMLEIVLGGVTSDMLAEAELPLLLSH
jgi:nucleotide-binding universal stress UspA family protein